MGQAQLYVHLDSPAEKMAPFKSIASFPKDIAQKFRMKFSNHYMVYRFIAREE